MLQELAKKHLCHATVGQSNGAVRDAWVRGALQQIKAGSRILDAGAGECHFKPDCAHLTYVSQDFCQYDGTGNSAAMQTGAWDTSAIDIVGDITAIPEPDASFDAILCTEVLEHVPNPPAVLKEFTRLLRSGGDLILTAPFCSLTHFAPYHFYSGFNRYFYEHHLKELGFDILEITENGNFFEFMGQELRRTVSIAAQYADMTTGLKEDLALEAILQFLEKASARDKGSKELLAYGYHVRARKR